MAASTYKIIRQLANNVWQVEYNGVQAVFKAAKSTQDNFNREIGYQWEFHKVQQYIRPIQDVIHVKIGGKSTVVMVLEWMEYNLKEACRLGLVSTEASITTTIKSVVHALLEMHKKNYAHHDVKPENIGVCIKNGEIVGAKLLDLGSCYRYNIALSPFIKMSDLRYTAPYRPPETWNLGITSTASDIFALGVTSRELWQHGMLHEEAPYRTETQIKEAQWAQLGLKGIGFYKNTTSYDGIANELWDKVLEPIPQRWKCLIRDMMEPDPFKRDTADTILKKYF